jgi:hypothetical protein
MGSVAAARGAGQQTGPWLAAPRNKAPVDWSQSMLYLANVDNHQVSDGMALLHVAICDSLLPCQSSNPQRLLSCMLGM